MKKIEIPFTKTKLLFGIEGSILFVVLGLYLFTTIAGHQSRFNPTLVKVAGIAGIVFFGTTGIYGVKKMFDNNVGLTIDDNGIVLPNNAKLCR